MRIRSSVIGWQFVSHFRSNLFYTKIGDVWLKKHSKDFDDNLSKSHTKHQHSCEEKNQGVMGFIFLQFINSAF